MFFRANYLLEKIIEHNNTNTQNNKWETFKLDESVIIY